MHLEQDTVYNDIEGGVTLFVKSGQNQADFKKFKSQVKKETKKLPDYTFNVFFFGIQFNDLHFG